MDVINIQESEEIVGGDIACIIACGISCYFTAWTATHVGVAFMAF